MQLRLLLRETCDCAERSVNYFKKCVLSRLVLKCEKYYAPFHGILLQTHVTQFCSTMFEQNVTLKRLLY